MVCIGHYRIEHQVIETDSWEVGANVEEGLFLGTNTPDSTWKLIYEAHHTYEIERQSECHYILNEIPLHFGPDQNNFKCKFSKTP